MRRLAGDLQSAPWLHRGTEHRRDRKAEEKLSDRHWPAEGEARAPWAAKALAEAAEEADEDDREPEKRRALEARRSEEAEAEALDIYMADPHPTTPHAGKIT